jgi:hypothetical protein
MGRSSAQEGLFMADRRAVLYDSGYPHWIVRLPAAAVSAAVILLFAALLASYFGWDRFKIESPLGRPIALAAAGGLSWLCLLCVFTRNVVYFDPDSDRLLLYGPGYAFRIREYRGIAVSQIAAISVQYHHSPGPAGRNDWTVDWIDATGHRQEIARMPLERDSRDAARRIGEAIGKPVA